MSSQDVQGALVGSFAAGHINEKEFIILYEEYQSANLCFPYWEYQPFRLDDLDNSKCRADFRIEKEDIPRLATALQIPPVFRCSQRRRFVFAPTKAFLPMSIPRYNPSICLTSTRTLYDSK